MNAFINVILIKFEFRVGCVRVNWCRDIRIEIWELKLISILNKVVTINLSINELFPAPALEGTRIRILF